ncbi:MAG: ribonuclease HI [Planctomycetaceae bacterium]|nr:ribonuclease HI [Planctomycetaceae bacterium]
MPNESSAAEVLLFSDGACSGNPGPGGWGCILRHTTSGTEKELSGGAANSTNNQMEMMAVISGLESLTRATAVEVITDSKYVADGCTSWMPNWKKNGWKRKDGSRWVPVKNVELWQRLDGLLAKHRVRFTVVKGHSGHPENERCDELAVAAARQFG